MIIDEDIYLEHYGVLGMRWGFRQQRKEDQRNRSPGKRRNDRQRAAASSVVGVGVFLASRNRMFNLPVSAIIGGGSAAATTTFMRNRYDRRISRHLKEVIN